MAKETVIIEKDGKTLRSVGDSGTLFIVVGSTQTLTEYCVSKHLEGLDVVKSSNREGAFFFVDAAGNALGKCSDDIEKADHPVISEYWSETAITELNPTGFFHMMHQRGNSDRVVTKLSFRLGA